MIGWMVIYIIALPVFGFFLPLYAFWNFDDFSWGNTRLAAGGADKSGHGAADGEYFDETSVSFLKLGDAQKIPLPQSGIVKSSRTQDPKATSRKATGKAERQGYAPSQIGDQASTVASSAMFYYPYPYPYGAPYQNYPPGYGGAVPSQFAPSAPTLDTSKPVKLEMTNGIPKALHPPPPAVSLPLARLIVGEIQAIIKTEDLRTLTKKNVRERVERNLRREASAVASGSEIVKRVDVGKHNDLVEVGKNPAFDFDLSNPAERREWINKVVLALLKDLV
jgi:chitin synthase